MFNKIQKDEKGQGLVEYGLILALVSVVAVGLLVGVGDKVSDTFGKVNTVMDGGIYSKDEIDNKVNKEGYIPISSAEDLDNIRNYGLHTYGKGTKWKGEYESGLGKSYILTTDINLSSINNFEPIGDSSNPFIGDFDGGGYGISGLSINRHSYVGLFGYVYGSSICNVALNEVNIDASGGDIGGLAGRARNSFINNVGISGELNGAAGDIGGIIGVIYSTEINSSWSDAVITSHGQNIGGMVGWMGDQSKIDSSHTTGDVIGETSFDIGGLVGDAKQDSLIVRTYTTGNVVGTHNTGGLVGRIGNQYDKNDNTRVDNSYSVSRVTGGSEGVGVLIGRVRSGGVVSNSSWSLETGDIYPGIGDLEGHVSNVMGQPRINIDRIIESLY